MPLCHYKRVNKKPLVEIFKKRGSNCYFETIQVLENYDVIFMVLCYLYHFILSERSGPRPHFEVPSVFINGEMLK